MGNFCWPKKSPRVVECIQQLQNVENTLALLVDKYDSQISEQKNMARKKLRQKDEAMRHVKTIHIIKHHKKKLEARLSACMDKRYHLESLNVTKMHIEAVKTTSKTFKYFLQENDMEKVEKLQDTLSDMIEDACEINETLSRQDEQWTVDESEIEDEYQQMCQSLQLPEPPSSDPRWNLQMVEVNLDSSEEKDSSEERKLLES